MGGISDGAGVAGAIAGRCRLCLHGNAFSANQRKYGAAEEYKEMVVAANSEDLVISAAITGTNASWLRASIEMAGLNPNDLAMPTARDYSGSANNKRWKDIWAAGQGVGRSKATEPLANIVADLETEYAAAINRFQVFTKS